MDLDTNCKSLQLWYAYNPDELDTGTFCSDSKLLLNPFRCVEGCVRPYALPCMDVALQKCQPGRDRVDENFMCVES